MRLQLRKFPTKTEHKTLFCEKTSPQEVALHIKFINGQIFDQINALAALWLQRTRPERTTTTGCGEKTLEFQIHEKTLEFQIQRLKGLSNACRS